MKILTVPKSTLSIDVISQKYSFLFGEKLSSESIMTRYILYEYLESILIPPPNLKKESTGKPIPFEANFQEDKKKSFFWSLSHTNLFCGFALSNSPIGFDIADIHPRDPSLFSLHSNQEYSLLGGCTWENFYILWTAKEAIIKRDYESLDALSSIELFQVKSSGALDSLDIGHIFDGQCLQKYLLCYRSYKKDISYIATFCFLDCIISFTLPYESFTSSPSERDSSLEPLLFWN